LVISNKQSGNLLDIGCAKGSFLLEMEKSSNWNLFGLEVNPQVAYFARKEYGLNVRVGDLENVQFPDVFFDVITLWDVLEHVHNPMSQLKEIFRILNSNGILVLRIPNYDSWESRLFGRYWAGLDAPRHLYVFSPDTITKYLKKSNFKVLEINTRSGGYSTFLLSLRFWLYDQANNHKFRDYVLNILSNPISRFLFFPLFFFSGLGLKGSVLTIIAVKNDRQ
jgi:SAM-dependent methyltransferase